MFSLGKLSILLLLGAAGFLWYRNAQFRERALRAAATHCRLNDIQHLDQSVVLRRMWPERSVRGGWILRRIYQFEFTSTGERRYQGLVRFHGKDLVSVELDAHQIPRLH